MEPSLIAFYLPQFHATAENDRWWGKGFTEWSSVRAGQPMFDGHYQPQIPGELGYYDLSEPGIRMAQAALAASYGIDAFCYYHYWFEGRRLLEEPFQQVLASGKPDFPFCLCWANETWTRRYDGSNRQVLMPQNYSEADDLEHIRWLTRAFLDRRYFRVDGKPLLLIYRARSLPSPARTLGTWREEATRVGVGELFVCAVESNFAEERRGDPTRLGFDAAVEFQPDIYVAPALSSLYAAIRLAGLSRVTRCLGSWSQLRSYSHLSEAAVSRAQANYRRFPCVTPAWDNAARRRQGGALIYAGSTPTLYENWLRQACESESRRGDSGLVFINAWNEWGEGCHLEPDLLHGRAYLDATLKAKNESRGRSTAPAATRLP